MSAVTKRKHSLQQLLSEKTKHTCLLASYSHKNKNLHTQQEKFEIKTKKKQKHKAFLLTQAKNARLLSLTLTHSLSPQLPYHLFTNTLSFTYYTYAANKCLLFMHAFLYTIIVVVVVIFFSQHHSPHHYVSLLLLI